MFGGTSMMYFLIL
uniref:Uncharacterized protein n=1 Tax=Arundo donax TaxID=35708 RepID=A0A0A9FRG3_ARUDO